MESTGSPGPDTSGATTSAESSPATTPATDDGGIEAIAATIRRGREAKPGKAKPAEASPRDAGERNPDDAAKAEQAEKTAARPESEDGKSADAESGKTKTKPPEAVPFKVFKERIDREKERAAKAETALASKDLEISRYAKAVELLKEQLAEEQEARRQGRQFDERDEEIRALRLRDRARAAVEETASEHAARLEAQRSQAQEAELVQTVDAEIRGALEQFPELHYEELREALEKDLRFSAPEMAKRLSEKKAAMWEARRPKQAAPPSPATARGTPAGAAPVYDDSESGIAARLRTMRGG